MVPVTPDHVRLSWRPPDHLSVSLRNRAILLLGFAGAFRRSELVALNVDDLEETAEGMLVDAAPVEDGSGRARSADCDPPRRDSVPRRSSPAWLDAAGVTEGAIFRRNLQQAGPAGHRSAPGASECRSDREA
jgi:hypothetical protein